MSTSKKPLTDQEAIELAIEKLNAHNGLQVQLEFLVEECAELIVAVKHFQRHRVDFEVVTQEMADVSLMIDCLLKCVNSGELRPHFELCKRIKLNRALQVNGLSKGIHGTYTVAEEFFK